MRSLGGKYRALFRDRSRVFEVGERTALVSLSAVLTRYDNDKGPIEREVSPAVIEELEIEVRKISVFDDDSLIGSYSGAEIPNPEVRYWETHARVWLERRLKNDPDYFNWFYDEGSK